MRHPKRDIGGAFTLSTALGFRSEAFAHARPYLGHRKPSSANIVPKNVRIKAVVSKDYP
jgi:hypothetical protein